MNMKEYQEIKNMKYREYCEYLKKKYGEAAEAYFLPNMQKNKNVSRTKDGLICHHICEDIAIMLSEPSFAINNPFEYQEAKNLVYCDYLEHLLLHIMICETPAENKNKLEDVGVGGVVNFLVPELNDFYSGWVTKQYWRLTCHNKVKEDKDVYLELIKRFKVVRPDVERFLYRSFNEKYGLWSDKLNKPLYEEMKKAK